MGAKFQDAPGTWRIRYLNHEPDDILAHDLGARVLFPSSPPPRDRTGTAVEITRRRAGWQYVNFAVRCVAPKRPWVGNTRGNECCLVLLQGECRVEFAAETVTLGPRADVFSAYPHALYLPPRTSFQVTALTPTELADGRAPTRTRHQARVIRPDDCGYEVRGGGNATRQIVDIVPPSFPAHRLMVCEVFTPSGNWSSYPPHKHDIDNPPGEVKLEEIYYYRFDQPNGFGLQRLYRDRVDAALPVRHGDVVLIRRGYHPFVAAYGYNAYYLNVLAGQRRSMAASDDPRYAAFRAWPAPDPRVPIVAPPTGGVHGT
jgi:5-deoxy-glucuronate isomerase